MMPNGMCRRGGDVRESPSFIPDNVSADKSCVVTSEGPSFDCSIGMKQECPLSPLYFSLYLDELEKRIQAIDCPLLANILIAILLFADDIALLSYS